MTIAVWMLLALQATVADGRSEVVVRASKLADAYAECLQARCSPERDAQVSIAQAEQQFRAGGYRLALATLSKAIGRNRAVAPTHPRSVAALHEAYATVALHEGEARQYRWAVGNRIKTLRDYLPADDPAVQEAAPALGDMWLALGYVHNAEIAYRAAEERARSAGQDLVAVNAAVRRIWLLALDGRVTDADRMLSSLQRDPIAAGKVTQQLLTVLQLKLALRFADAGTADRLMRSLSASAKVGTPALVWAPPYDREPLHRMGPDTSTFNFEVPVRSRLDLTRGLGLEWLDVGFWIRSDGRVAEVEPLRGTAVKSDWTKVVTDQISARRYAPMTGDVPPQGIYRIQRFTLRASYAVQMDDLARSRSGPVQLEAIDLTDGDTPPPDAAPIPAALP